MAGLGDLQYLPQTPSGDEPTYRMSMLPFGTYANPDGTESLGFALPGMIHEPLMAAQRLFGTPSQPGTFGQGPDYGVASDNPVRSVFPNQNDMATLGMTFYGGNAMNPGRLMEGAGAAEVPAAIRAYHGTNSTFDHFDTPSVFAASNPEMASNYALYGSAERPGSGPNIIPLDMHGSVFDASSVPLGQNIRRLAEQSGHPIIDWGDGAYEAIRPGTVTSPLTGETLFSDTGRPSLMGAAIAGAGSPSVSPLEWGSFSNGARFGSKSVHTPDGRLASYADIVQRPEGLELSNITTFPEYRGQGYAKSLVDDLLKEGNGSLSLSPLTDDGRGFFGKNYPSLVPASHDETLFSDVPTYADGGTVADMPALPALPDYGFGPMTQTTIAGYPNAELRATPDPIDRLRSIGEMGAGPVLARSIGDQFNTATSGVADALADPSLANVTNAGVQTGLAIGSPTLATISGLGGMGIAAARDLGLGGLSTPAQAGTDVDSMVKGDPQLELLYQTYQDELAKSTANVPGRNRTESAAIRNAAGQRAAAAMQAINTALAQRQAAALSQKNADHQALLDKQKADYDNAVNVATNARDMELGRDRRFSDTDVGKVYDKLGGYAPLVAGFVPGVVSRLAYGPAANLGSKALRAFTGAGFGVGANNVPLVYNAFSTEVDNPEQRAYNAYAYNLPDGHPDKAKAQAMADSLPKLNPLRQEAQDELYDPIKFGERAAMGALEGFGGNELGQMAPGGLGGLFRRSSYQLPPSSALASTEATPLAQQAAASKLLAGNDTILDRTSGPVGPASGQSLPALAAPSDIAPATAKKPAAGRRSKSAGSKGSAKPETILPAPASDTSPSPDTQSAAAGEVRRFLGKGPEPMFAAGGSVDGGGTGGQTHSGPLHSSVAGRTDALPITVKAGSFVVPADVVGALGENNTLAGTKVLDHMFPKRPEKLAYAAGGSVPIMAAGGEYVISPESVAALGGGDLTRGHNILDKFVLNTRNESIKTLKSLPGPSR